MKPIFKLENQTSLPYHYDKKSNSYDEYIEIKKNKFSVFSLIKTSIDNFLSIKELSEKMMNEKDKEKYHELKIQKDINREKLIKKLKIFNPWYIKRRMIDILSLKIRYSIIDDLADYLYYIINDINQSSTNDYLNKLFNDILIFYNKSNQYELIEYLKIKSKRKISSIDLSILNNKFNEYREIKYRININKEIDKKRGEI